MQLYDIRALIFFFNHLGACVMFLPYYYYYYYLIANTQTKPWFDEPKFSIPWSKSLIFLEFYSLFFIIYNWNLDFSIQ